MIFIPRRHLLALPLALLLLGNVHAAAAEPARAPTTVELSAEASRPARNDMATAILYFQADDKSPAALSRQVNAAIAAALEQTRTYPAVKAKTSGASTFPVYGKEGRKIEGWRMRSEIHLESRDIAALSELLGKLQSSLALASLAMQPAPDTRKSTADLAATDAIHAFQARAQSIAGTLGKPYRIRHLSVTYGGNQRPVFPVMKSAAFAADAAPMAVEAGESEIAVTVSGTIELSD
ncbi:SIMPL domain-containing protein [Aromatoleum diolicum]|uniref:DUF541 domain-containing protein n=1 Tax=Aromatoleum diolicum TaxID=75796 RepID=A0ABX1QEB0_9RHOO|nr:SIMPL domain-containing protein [Aromatoleum diolicum]NMG75524.1 DUF541 domain-containing protein [Aromatoleum diolicum]